MNKKWIIIGSTVLASLLLTRSVATFIDQEQNELHAFKALKKVKAEFSEYTDAYIIYKTEKESHLGVTQKIYTGEISTDSKRYLFKVNATTLEIISITEQ
ncbi:hypothetical protein [Abyssicoccus albus]|uniref:Putative small secreted protein n=1 Tax=Abyssicoccus albus TaxID=1817405 RepID=A0A3N5BRK9_9BACL|nr:hypothetical protein [Abyssicoccus albus]RPF57680.1 putative small secreted protein [Abyssicoccus albus]